MPHFDKRVECGRNFPGHTAGEPRLIGYECAGEGWKNNADADACAEENAADKKDLTVARKESPDFPPIVVLRSITDTSDRTDAHCECEQWSEIRAGGNTSRKLLHGLG